MKEGANYGSTVIPKAQGVWKSSRRYKIQAFDCLMLDEWFTNTFSQVFAFTLNMAYPVDLPVCGKADGAIGRGLNL